MPKKPTRKKSRPPNPSIAERAAALERAQLRRAGEHQRRVTMLSRSLARAV